MKYLNFDLELFDYKNAEKMECFRVRVSSSPRGEQNLSDAETVRLPIGFHTLLRSLERRELQPNELIDLGLTLGDALFPPKVRALFNESKASLDDAEGLRVRLKLDTYALADLPWEYAYLADPNTPADQRGVEGFVVFDRRLSLVRYQVLQQPIGKLDTVKTLRLVALLSNPHGSPDLNLQKEQQKIQSAVKGIPRIQADFYPNATLEVLLDSMVKGANIFHFSGHGIFDAEMGTAYGTQEGKGYLAFNDDQGNEIKISAQKFALSLAGRGVRLCILNACESSKVDQVNAWTGVAPALTRAGIPAVLGMQFKIFDKNAITFSKSFYSALANGQTIDEAVTEGRQAIFITSDDGERDWGVPVLYLRAEEGILFPNPATQTQSATTSVTTISGTSVSEDRVNQKVLREALVQFFDSEELAVICADVQNDLANMGINIAVNLEMVGGEGKRAKVLNLIQYLDRRGYLGYLVKAVRSARPGQNII